MAKSYTQLQCRIPTDLYRKLESAAAQLGPRKLTAAVIAALEAYVAKQK